MGDSDRYTADECAPNDLLDELRLISLRSALGYVEVDLSEFSDQPHQMIHREDALSPLNKARACSGTLAWSAGYFGVCHIHQEPKDSKGLKSKRSKEEMADRHHTLLERHERQANTHSRAGLYSDRIREMLEAKTPPHPSQMTGLLIFQIHQLANLELPSLRGAVAKGAKSPKSPTSEERILPSTYTVSCFNDTKVFQTRLKKVSGMTLQATAGAKVSWQLTASPYINAGTEVFCPDWTMGRLDVAVFDARTRGR